jgi:AraC-like DNA-binding protein
MDALSEALRAVRVTSALFFNGEFSAPWRFKTPSQDKVAPLVSPGSEHLVLFHLVTDGHATARTSGEEEVALTAGDIVAFPHGDAHELWNGRTTRLFPGKRLLPKLSAGEVATEKWGGNGPVTRIICGYFGCERHAEELFLNGLPAVLKLHVRGNPAGTWIESAIRHSVSEIEAQRPGRTAVLSKLAEALFMETLCRYMEGLPPDHRSWLAAARDPKIGKALALLHRDPARPWTLANLAEASGASRSVLAERFTELMGEPPLAYLARWRMQLGARQLLTTAGKVLQVAYEVGYESEAAFSRAFKRAFGVPPARYRRERGQQPRTRRR